MSKKAAAAKASAESLAALAEFSTEAPRVYPSAKQTAATEGGKRRPGRPRSEGEIMVPFASRVRESCKQQLAQLAHATRKTETALLDEALSLLFRRHKVNS